MFLGNGEVVNDETGFLVKENFSIEELVKLVSNFEADKKLQLKLRKGARKYALLLLTAKRIFKNFIREMKKWKN